MPLKKYCEIYPWPSIQTLRWMIWKLETTLGQQAPFVARYGRRVLIDGQKFQDWVASQQDYSQEWHEKSREITQKRREKNDSSNAPI